MKQDYVIAQISAHPLDVRHMEHLLAHQIRVWSPMVDRIHLTIDTHQSKNGRYRAENYNASYDRLKLLTAEAQKTCANLVVEEVDYHPATKRWVGECFFGQDIPVKAWDGGPFYSYFYALAQAYARYVIHLDSDMLFGGGSRVWVMDAVKAFRDRPDIDIIAPFPGPPHPAGEIYGHHGEYRYEQSLPPLAYRHQDVSTRCFMIDLKRLNRFPLLEPSRGRKIKSLIQGNEPVVLEAETCMTQALIRRGSYRLDMLGGQNGLWSLHPPYRSEHFYQQLPQLIEAVEAGKVADGQRGHYDLNDSMIDWSSARATNTKLHRLWKMAKQRFSK
jgi:hypothetical protein